jgi:hypothetical protein
MARRHCPKRARKTNKGCVSLLTNFPRNPSEYLSGGLSVQEAHMRQLLSIVALAALVSVVADVMIAPGKPAAHMEVTNSQFQNGVSVYGLHIALPDTMKTFPAELVPLP